MNKESSALLVTGAQGYLGSRIVTRLQAEGAIVIPTSRKGVNPCDLMDEASVINLIRQREIKTVIHCAAFVPKTSQDFSNTDVASVNVHMVSNLIAAKPEHIVFTSSMTVYRPGTIMPAREDTEISGLIGYPASKKAAEEMLLNTNEVKATILRLTGLFGLPRRDGFLYNVVKAFVSRQPITLPKDPVLWSTMHVDDAADLCIRAARRKPETSLIINAAYPGAQSIPLVLAQIAALFSAPVPECISMPVLEMDTTRLKAGLGLPRSDFTSRLQEFISEVKAEFIS